jgi:hypothetical protein
MVGSSAAALIVRVIIQPADAQEAETHGGTGVGQCPTEPKYTVPEQEGETDERH